MVTLRKSFYVLLAVAMVAMCAAAPAPAADYLLEAVEDGLPSDDLEQSIAAVVSPDGVRVKRGPKRTICEFWPCKSWPIVADFQANSEVIYPFEPGQLVGVLRFRRRGSDFRDQRIDRGVYTLRYGHQPVDGNHEGTSPTRDFLLMVKAEEDDSPAHMEKSNLEEASAEAAGSEHPALIAMQRPVADDDAGLPALRHDEDHDWWILQIAAPVEGDDSNDKIVIEFVVVGVAEE